VGVERWFCRSAHCLSCKKNLNNIDLLMTLDYDFRDAVVFLAGLLNQHQAQQPKGKSPANPSDS